jgi:hypothetical protein
MQASLRAAPSRWRHCELRPKRCKRGQPGDVAHSGQHCELRPRAGVEGDGIGVSQRVGGGGAIDVSVGDRTISGV